MKPFLHDTVLRLPYIPPVLSSTWISASSLSLSEDQRSDRIGNTNRADVKSGLGVGGIDARQ